MDRSAEIHRGIVYTPLPSQKRFHDLDCRFKGFSGPIGSGKSQALCHEAIRLTYQNPGRMGLLGAPTYPMLRDVTQTALFQILEKNKIPFDLNKSENAAIMRDTSSKIVFRPVEDFERLRGTNLAWFGVDELTYTQEEAWLRLEGRLRDPEATRLCGFGVWTPKGYDWVYKKFIHDPKAEYEAIVAQPEENRFLLAKVPNFYTRLADSYDTRFYLQEVRGEYLALDASRVYSSFDRRNNLRSACVDPRSPLYWALDFNVDPMASIVLQKLSGKFFVIDEIFLRHATTQEAAQEFLRRYPQHLAGVRVYGDAAGQHSQSSTGMSDFDVIREFFAANSMMRPSYHLSRANPAVRDRINLVNGLLRSANDNVSLYIDPKCTELISDLEQVNYKADTNQVDKDRDRLRTHLSDALGYVLCIESKSAVGERSQPFPF
jgi:Terminase large subunit, T4likevirus-type, N-terminal